jgi:membrane-bound lytic murein transglycosylase F
MPLVLWLSLGILAGCSDAPDTAAGEDATVAATASRETREAPASTQHTPQGRQDASAEDEAPVQAKLRILLPTNIAGGRYLPRSDSPIEAQRELAIAFARAIGMQPELVVLDNFRQLVPALIEDRGDILVANLTVTPERQQQIDFTVPLTHVREQLIVAATDDSISEAADLDGKRVMAPRESSFWETLSRLQKRHPGMQLMPRPEGMLDEEALDLVVNGEVDAVVRDSNVAQMYLAYRDDIKVAFNLGGPRPIAWGVSKNRPELRAELNRWLHVEHLAGDPGNADRAGDLDRIRERRTLRVLMRNNGASYFIYRGQLMGFEYEMAREFADAHGLRLQVIVPPSHADMFTWLKQGRGDLAVGFLEPRDSIRAEGIAFSRPYNYALRHIVVNRDGDIESPDDMIGRTVVTRPSSGYWDSVEDLRAQGHWFELEAAAEDTEVEELLARVGAGEIDATVADQHLLDLEQARDTPVREVITLEEEREHAVAMLAGNTQLLKAVNDFIKKNHRGLVYNVLYKKYFKNPRSIKRFTRERIAVERDGRLSPWDDVVRRYANEYGFDWRLLVAQMYQESRFDPKASSFAGAKGLMQVMPRTAESLGIKDLEQPETGILAGVKYLDWVRHRFSASLPVGERIWFSLAAYNAGVGHVQDARRLARQKGLDPDRWFDNTERTMLLLSKEKYASKARYGYVRGSEPVNYVRNIRERFLAYADVTPVPQSSSGLAEPDTGKIAAQ